MRKDLGKEKTISASIATVNGARHTSACFYDGE